jgi:Cupredoxin-like domain
VRGVFLAATAPPTATAPSAPAPPEDAQGGAGDEAAARTRITVVVDAEGITPPRLDVPAFLAVRITVRNDLPGAITVAVRGAHRSVRVPARARRAVDVDGLQPGEYPVDAGVAGRTTLVAVRP